MNCACTNCDQDNRTVLKPCEFHRKWAEEWAKAAGLRAENKRCVCEYEIGDGTRLVTEIAKTIKPCAIHYEYAVQQIQKSQRVARVAEPVPMRLTCPDCGALHIDEGEFATKPHHTHACQVCGMVWRPAVVATVGVRFLPGHKGDSK